MGRWESVKGFLSDALEAYASSKKGFLHKWLWKYAAWTWPLMVVALVVLGFLLMAAAKLISVGGGGFVFYFLIGLIITILYNTTSLISEKNHKPLVAIVCIGVPLLCGMIWAISPSVWTGIRTSKAFWLMVFSIITALYFGSQSEPMAKKMSGALGALCLLMLLIIVWKVVKQKAVEHDIKFMSTYTPSVSAARASIRQVTILDTLTVPSDTTIEVGTEWSDSIMTPFNVKSIEYKQVSACEYDVKAANDSVYHYGMQGPDVILDWPLYRLQFRSTDAETCKIRIRRSM